MKEAIAYAPAAPPVKPGRLPPLLCGYCGTCAVPLIGPGAQKHVARALCSNPACGRFLRWLPRALFQQEGVAVGCINRVFLCGEIGRSGVTVKFAQSGAACANFTLVLTEQGSDGKEHATFVDCECWGKKAEAASELEPGQLALFEDKLAKRKRGETWELVVSGFELSPVLPAHASMTGRTN
jgi:hypothetical protein